MKKAVYPAIAFFLLYYLTFPLNAQTLVNQVEVDTLSHSVSAYNYMAATSDDTGGFYIAQNNYIGGIATQAGILHQTNYGTAWVTVVNANSSLQSYITGICYHGNYVYATGFALNTSTNTSSFYTVKLDAGTGDTIWTQTYTGAYAYAAGTAVVVDSSGNIYVCGTEQTSTDYRMDLLKYDSNGTQLWMNYYDSVGLNEGAVGMVLNPGSNIAITGYSGATFSSWDFATTWFSLSGAKLSTARSANGSGNFSQPVTIMRDPAQNILIIGTAATIGSNSNIKLVQYDSTFTQTWVHTYGDSASAITASGAVNDGDNHIIVTGTATNASGGKDMYIFEINHGTTSAIFNIDTLYWTKRISAPNPAWESSTPAAPAIDNYGNVIVSGRIFSGSHFGMTTNALDINGNMLWQKTYKRTPATDDAATAVLANGNSIFVCGGSIGTDTIFNLVRYQTLPITIQALTDTAGNPLYMQGNLIIRFSPSVLDTNEINNSGKIFGTPDEILKPAFNAPFESKLGSLGIDGKSCYLQKLAPNYHTWNKTLISTIGDTIKISPFWASFLLMYPSTGIETQVRDSMQTLYPNIQYAQLDYVGVTSSSCTCSTICANDTLYPLQYGFHDDSTNDYTFGNVNAEGAWVIEQGKRFIKVGVFDTGIKWVHQDFTSSDGSSKIIDGYDYIYQPGNLFAESDSGDFDGHGTQIAGIIGALRDNVNGVAGIAGGNECDASINHIGSPLYSFGVAYPSSGAQNGALVPMSAVVQALNDALSNDSTIGYSNMNILNCSYNLYSSDTSFPEFKEKYYYAFRLGKTVVASVGNIDQNHLHPETSYPINFPDDWLIGVGGSDQNGDLATNIPLNGGHVGSQSGYPIDIVAPFIGTMNYSTDISETAPYTNSKTYGTSFSAPYASGLAALLLSHLNNPNGLPDPANLVVEDVEHMMQRTAFLDLNAYTPPYDVNVGWGRVDLGKTMEMADTTHAHILHFNSVSTSSTISMARISGVNAPLTLQDAVPGDSLIFPAKGYVAEIWKYTAVVHHDISLKPGTAIKAGWARSSSSYCYALADSFSVGYMLDPYEKAYMDSSVIPDSSNATIWGYFYLLKDSLNPLDTLGWIPQNPMDTTNPPKLSYTIYIDTVSPVILGEQNLKTKDDFTFQAFPNPAADYLHVNLIASNDGLYNISIINSVGQPVRKLYESQTTGLSANYNISNLESGLYFIRAQTANSSKTIKLSIIK